MRSLGPTSIESQERKMELKQSAAPDDVSPRGDGRTYSTRVPYTTPRLKAMGDVRAVTLGASPGATESSGGSVSRKPAGT